VPSGIIVISDITVGNAVQIKRSRPRASTRITCRGYPDTRQVGVRITCNIVHLVSEHVTIYRGHQLSYIPSVVLKILKYSKKKKPAPELLRQAQPETKCSSHSVRVCPKGIVFEGSPKLHVDESKNLQILNI
jgi:hypothetical protein